GWSGPFAALSSDIDNDGLDDLMTWNWEGAGLTNGVIIPVPKLLIFRGKGGQRWGHDGRSRAADWWYWSTDNVIFDKIDVLDHDSDATPAVFLYANSVVPRAFLSILYGSPGALPDTADIQSISLFNAGGRCALFTDVTGDHVPELIV